MPARGEAVCLAAHMPLSFHWLPVSYCLPKVVKWRQGTVKEGTVGRLKHLTSFPSLVFIPSCCICLMFTVGTHLLTCLCGGQNAHKRTGFRKSQKHWLRSYFLSRLHWAWETSGHLIRLLDSNIAVHRYNCHSPGVFNESRDRKQGEDDKSLICILEIGTWLQISLCNPLVRDNHHILILSSWNLGDDRMYWLTVGLCRLYAPTLSIIVSCEISYWIPLSLISWLLKHQY